jgi:hypothetical protein
MWRLCWAPLAAGLALAPAWSQEPPKKTDPPARAEQKPRTPAEEYKAVEAELQAQQSAALKKFTETKDPGEKAKIRDEFMKLRTSSQEKLSALAKKYPKEEFAFAALSSAAASGDAQAIDQLLQHHANNKNIGNLCLQLGMQGNAKADKLIRSVLEKAKTDELKGTATVALALSLKSQADEAEDEKKAAQLQKEAEGLFEAVEKNYGKVTTPFGPASETAKKNLFELRHLAVGKSAPDLTGEDLDSKPIKISDYRGKVIMLDFWAHW